MNEEYMHINQQRWDEMVGIHEKSAFYDVAGFKAGLISSMSFLFAAGSIFQIWRPEKMAGAGSRMRKCARECL